MGWFREFMDAGAYILYGVDTKKAREQKVQRRGGSGTSSRPGGQGGTRNATAFRDKPQRNDPTVTNTYFNGPGDGDAHGHVKYRDNPDGTTDYLYARDVEGTEYDV